MKLNIDFLQTGGVPLTNDLMRDVMDAIRIFDVLGELAGDFTILSGGEPVSAGSTTFAPGIVAINGEVLVFEGGVNAGTVFIHEEEILKTFQDQTDKILIRKKTVKFGNALQTYNWADFVKLDTIKEIMAKANAAATQQQLTDLQTKVTLLELKTAPIDNGNIVLPWRKPLADIPAGWKECTDFRGKTIVGLDPNDITFSTLNANIGSKTKTIAKANLPAVGINYEDVEPGNPDWGSGGFDGGNNHFVRRQKTTANLGSGTPIDVLNPMRIVYFIEPNFQ